MKKIIIGIFILFVILGIIFIIIGNKNTSTQPNNKRTQPNNIIIGNKNTSTQPNNIIINYHTTRINTDNHQTIIDSIKAEIKNLYPNINVVITINDIEEKFKNYKEYFANDLSKITIKITKGDTTDIDISDINVNEIDNQIIDSQIIIGPIMIPPDTKGENTIQNIFKKWKSVNKQEIINKYGEISQWNTSLVTDMSNLFKGDEVFNEDITGWDTSNVTTMKNMFNGAGKSPVEEYRLKIPNCMGKKLNELWNKDSSDPKMAWATSQGLGVFWQRLRYWPVQNIHQISCVNSHPIPWTSVEPPPNTGFNQDISNWNTSLVKNMEGMFQGALNFNNGQEINSDDKAFIQKENGWNTSNVTTMKNMFKGAMNFDQDISTWDIGNVLNIENMFDHITIGQEYPFLSDTSTQFRAYFYDGNPTPNSNKAKPFCKKLICNDDLLKNQKIFSKQKGVRNQPEKCVCN